MTKTTGKTRVFVAGHRGMVGSAIVRHLAQDPSVDIITRSRDELDLTNQAQVQRFFAETSIDQVYLGAAKVGGIYANNTYPAEFIYQNLMIEVNTIHSAFEAGVKKLLFLGSSCIYPRDAAQPMSEDALLSGCLEPTNEPYAIAKIAGIKLCESYNRQYGDSHQIDYRSVMPTNLYGPGDNYHPENSHVIPALIRRIHEAKAHGSPTVKIWGTGLAQREFLHVDDMARASIHVMDLSPSFYGSIIDSMCSHINIGAGHDYSVADLAKTIASVIGYTGEFVFDTSKPDGAPKKLMGNQRALATGWAPKIELRQGLESTYADFLAAKISRQQIC